MIVKLAYRNMRKSVSNYAVYFLTLVLGVSLFYTFNSVVDQNVVLMISSYPGGYQDASELYGAMTICSAIVTVILSFLVMYAGNFLMRRRKREFGLYMLLGMGKGNVVGILVLETVFVGIFSLVGGLLLGIALSQGVSIIVSRLFELDMTNFSFFVSGDAIRKTLLYFLLIYVCDVLCELLVISQDRLIGLFRTKKGVRTEAIRNPVSSFGELILSVALFLFVYYYLLQVAGLVRSWMGGIWIIPLVGVVGILVGTLLFFRSLSGAVIYLAERRRSFYMRGLNFFTVREYADSFGSSIFSGCVVCLLLVITICTITVSVYSVQRMNVDMKELTPTDINVDVMRIPGDNEEAEEATWKSVKELLVECDTDMSLLGASTEVSMYEIYDTDHPMAMAEYDSFEDVSAESLSFAMRISDYNRLASFYGSETYELDAGEYLIVANEPEAVRWFEQVKLDGEAEISDVTLDGKTYVPREKECRDGFFEMDNERCFVGMYILPDDAPLRENMIYKKLFVANYAAGREEEAEAYFSSEEYTERINRDFREGLDQGKAAYALDARTRQGIWSSDRVLSVALPVFVGLYLGIIFLITGAAVLSLKELSRTVEMKERYRILHQLGTEEGMMRRSHRFLSLTFFAAPLFLAVVHSVFCLRVGFAFLYVRADQVLTASVVSAIALILVIYGVYYLVAYRLGKAILFLQE